jgi:uncharacterized protein YegP (UPF0339 family)
MASVSVELHPRGGFRWVLLDNGTRIHLGSESYTSEWTAQRAGARQVRAMNTRPKEGYDCEGDNLC